MEWISVKDRLPEEGMKVAAVIEYVRDNDPYGIILAIGSRVPYREITGSWDLKCCSCSYDAFTQYVDDKTSFVTHWVKLDEFKDALGVLLPKGLMPMGCLINEE